MSYSVQLKFEATAFQYFGRCETLLFLYWDLFFEPISSPRQSNWGLKLDTTLQSPFSSFSLPTHTHCIGTNKGASYRQTCKHWAAVEKLSSSMQFRRDGSGKSFGLTPFIPFDLTLQCYVFCCDVVAPSSSSFQPFVLGVNRVREIRRERWSIHGHNTAMTRETCRRINNLELLYVSLLKRIKKLLF